MSVNRVVAKVLSRSDTKVISGKCVGQINPYIEWVKWLSYESEYEKQMIDFVDGKAISELSYLNLKK